MYLESGLKRFSYNLSKKITLKYNCTPKNTLRNVNTSKNRFLYIFRSYMYLESKLKIFEKNVRKKLPFALIARQKPPKYILKEISVYFHIINLFGNSI